jgi:hypothetical protein
LVVALVACVALTAFGAAKCKCHGVLATHKVIAGSPMRVDLVQAVVSTKSGSETFELNKDGVVNLGTVKGSEMKDVAFVVSVIDPDDDVCETGADDAFAGVSGTVTVSVNGTAMTLKGKSGIWTGKWNPKNAGTYTFVVSIDVADDACDHPQSNDADLDLTGYTSQIVVQ